MRPATLVAAASAAVAASRRGPLVPGVSPFVVVEGGRFKLGAGGEPWAAIGTNSLGSQVGDAWMAGDLMNRTARANGTHVRAWVFSEAHFCGGAASPRAGSRRAGYTEPVFQCWENATARVVINEAALVHVDAIVAAAGAAGIRLTMTLANNWASYGGIDSYMTWRGAYAAAANDSSWVGYHDDFYSDPVVEGWYRAWVTALVSRTNSITGVRFVNDPAIFAWELGNELACAGEAAPFPTSGNCAVNGSNAMTAAWVGRSAALIHALDPNHLVAIGDIGWYGVNRGDVPCPRNQWWCNGDSGDWLSLLAVPGVDFATCHDYPDDSRMGEWGLGPELAVGEAWVVNHTRQAAALGKPLVLEEFGYATNSSSTQHAIYEQLLAAAQAAGAGGWDVWMLASLNDVYYPAPSWPNWYKGGDAALQVYCVGAGDPAPPADGEHDPATCATLAAIAGAWRP